MQVCDDLCLSWLVSCAGRAFPTAACSCLRRPGARTPPCRAATLPASTWAWTRTLSSSSRSVPYLFGVFSLLSPVSTDGFRIVFSSPTASFLAIYCCIFLSVFSPSFECLRRLRTKCTGLPAIIGVVAHPLDRLSKSSNSVAKRVPHPQTFRFRTATYISTRSFQRQHPFQHCQLFGTVNSRRDLSNASTLFSTDDLLVAEQSSFRRRRGVCDDPDDRGIPLPAHVCTLQPFVGRGGRTYRCARGAPCGNQSRHSSGFSSRFDSLNPFVTTVPIRVPSLCCR